MDSHQRLCQPCMDLEIGEPTGGKRKEERSGEHPGWQTLKTLGDSGRTCDLCKFFYEEGIRMLQTTTSFRTGKDVSQTPPEDLSITFYVAPDQTCRMTFDGQASIAAGVLTSRQYEVVTTHPAVAEKSLFELVREVPESPTHSESLSTIHGWMHICSQEHERCRDIATLSFTPHRLLYVGSLEAPQLRLVANDDNTQDRYIALSHCWGKSQPFVLNTQNVASFRASIDESRAPKTFQDAFHFSRMLGVSMVWIDSLCIIQDDRLDWEIQSAQMGRIYKHALLTIAASCSVADSEGFIRNRKSSFVRCGSKHVQGVKHDIFMSERHWSHEKGQDTNPIHKATQHEPLSTRGWVIQERILPRRSVSFTTNQLLWQCKTLIAFEDGRNAPIHESSQEYGVDRWDDIVENFTACKLTRASDKLPALSGVASEIALKKKDVYLAGHWLRDLPKSLAWCVKLKTNNTPMEIPENMYRAPSWSWASSDGPLTFQFGREDVHAKVIDYDIQVVSKANPHGEVSAGHLTISAPFGQFDLGETFRGVPYRAQFRARTLLVPNSDRVSFDTEHPDRDLSSIRFAIVNATWYGTFFVSASAILLEPCDEDGIRYKRIGLLWHIEILPEEFEMIELKEITLI